MGKDVLVLTDANWKKEVSESEVPVLVDFWAEWCPPCRMVAPVVEAVAGTYSGRLKVGKLNVDENPEVSETFAIRSIPTLLVFKNGQLVGQQIGAVPQSRIVALVEAHLEQQVAGQPAGQEAEVGVRRG